MRQTVLAATWQNESETPDELQGVYQDSRIVIYLIRIDMWGGRVGVFWTKEEDVTSCDIV